MDEELIGLSNDISTDEIESSTSGMVSEVPEDFGGRLIYGLKMSAVGMSVVFAVLIILMLIIKLFEFLTYTLPNKRKKAAETKVAEPAETANDNPDNDSEIAAVIAAAVDAYYNNDPTQAKKHYQVKSFKRI